MNDEIKLPRFELGNPGFERDALLAVALSGRKTATSSLLREWQEEDTLLPEPGDLQIMINSAGDEVARVIITKVEVRKLGEVGGKGTLKFVLNKPIPYDLIKKVASVHLEEKFKNN